MNIDKIIAEIQGDIDLTRFNSNSGEVMGDDMVSYFYGSNEVDAIHMEEKIIILLKAIKILRGDY